MSRKRLELEMETESETSTDHPASKMFEGKKKKRAAQNSSPKPGRAKNVRGPGRKPKGAITVTREGIRGAYSALKRSDRDVIDFLKRLQGRRANCKASIPGIAKACNISERQVQISTQRLIEAELLERVGYDLGNSDRAERGTIFNVLM